MHMADSGITGGTDDLPRPGAADADGPVTPGGVEAFRMSFVWLFLYVIVIGVSIAALLILTAHVITLTPPDPVGLLLAITGAEGAGFFLLLAYVGYFKVYVSPEGLRCFNLWGLYRLLRWDDFRSVRPINALGLRYLLAYPADGGSALWLPLFLADGEGFHRLVREYAGPAHPLSRALLDEGA
jgi:hypothetical protein